MAAAELSDLVAARVDAHMHAVVHVFDAQGDGVGAVLGAGLAASPYPEDDAQVVELVPLATAIEKTQRDTRASGARSDARLPDQ
jgi:hypothetical protein